MQKAVNNLKGFGLPGAIISVTLIGGIGAYKLYTSIFNKTNNNIDKKKRQAKQKGEPQQFKHNLKIITQEFLKQLQQNNFHANLQKKDNKKHIMFIGPTSVGKSSLINEIFQTKLKTGVGVTTSKVQIAFQDQNIRVFDSAGQNSDFQFFEIEKLSLIHVMDTIFILYRFTPQAIQFLIKVICGYKKAKYKVIFIRTCCDQFTSIHERSIDQQIQQDYKIIKSFGVQSPIILKTSSKYKQKQKKFDNDLIKKLL